MAPVYADERGILRVVEGFFGAQKVLQHHDIVLRVSSE